MNRQLKRQIGMTLCSLIFISSSLFSQIKSFDFLRSAPADATKYLQAYMAPYANAFGAGLNGGWYNTAKPHKLLGFDLTMNVSAGAVPTSAQSFDLTKIGLSSAITATGTAPTVAGSKTAGPNISYKAGSVELANFKAPAGTGFRYVPVPTLQVGLGLPLGTEVKVRYIPNVNIGKNGNISLWGVGLMHNLTQYLPGDKLLPFDVSVFGGYTKLNTNAHLSIQPPDYSNYTSPYSSASFNNQNMNIVVSALNVSAIASLNLPVITFYGGLGYSKTKTELKLSGNFPTPEPNGTAPIYKNSGVVAGTAFPAINIEDFSGVRANIGLRIKLAIITIHADYTRAQYNVFSTGLGFSFR
jgi:hypothetical protein